MSNTHPPLNFGIIGCGRVVERRVAPAIGEAPNARIAAFCSRDASKARVFARLFGIEKSYHDIDALLADGDVHAVYIAVPNSLHAELAIRCLRAGKHVLVDKPMALDSAQASAMVNVARDCRRTLGVLHQQRFHPANQQLFAAIRNGDLGTIHFIRAHMGFWYSLGENWRLERALSGGGAAMDLAPHALDILLQAAGPIKTVDARSYNLHFQGNVEDMCTALLEFHDGAVGQVDFSYCTHHYGGRIEVYGSEGTFLADGSLQQGDAYRIARRQGSEDLPIEEGQTPSCFKLIIEDFAEAIRENREPTVSLNDGLRVMQTIDALYESSRTYRPADVR